MIRGGYRRLWCGQAVSSVGDKMFATTLILWVSQQLAGGRPWAAVAVGGLLAAAGAAAILVGPVAGVLVDRWDRISLMTLTEGIRATLSAGLAILSFLPARDLPAWIWLAAMYAAVFTLAACGQFFTLAQLAFIGDLARGEAERARVTAITEATVSAAAMIGPPIAAPIMLAIGPQWGLAANAASYVVSCLVTRSLRAAARPIRPRPRTGASLRAEFADGLRIFRRNRYVAALLSVTVICQVGAAAITTLNVFFLTTSLHASASLYGTAEMVMGAGFIAGALAAGRLVRRFGARAVTWSGLFAAGGLTVAYALQRDAAAGLVILGLYAVMISLLNTAAAPILLAAAPREFRGRVLAVFGPVNQLVSSVWIVLWGWLADTVLRSFHASPCGVPLDAVSLIFVIAGCLIIAAGVRALISLPPAPGSREGRRIPCAQGRPGRGSRNASSRVPPRPAAGTRPGAPGPHSRLPELQGRAHPAARTSRAHRGERAKPSGSPAHRSILLAAPDSTEASCGTRRRVAAVPVSRRSLVRGDPPSPGRRSAGPVTRRS
jgi:MFS family permease